MAEVDQGNPSLAELYRQVGAPISLRTKWERSDRVVDYVERTSPRATGVAVVVLGFVASLAVAVSLQAEHDSRLYLAFLFPLVLASVLLGGVSTWLHRRMWYDYRMIQDFAQELRDDTIQTLMAVQAPEFVDGQWALMESRQSAVLWAGSEGSGRAIVYDRHSEYFWLCPSIEAAAGPLNTGTYASTLDSRVAWRYLGGSC